MKSISSIQHVFTLKITGKAKSRFLFPLLQLRIATFPTKTNKRHLLITSLGRCHSICSLIIGLVGGGGVLWGANYPLSTWKCRGVAESNKAKLETLMTACKSIKQTGNPCSEWRSSTQNRPEPEPCRFFQFYFKTFAKLGVETRLLLVIILPLISL